MMSTLARIDGKKRFDLIRSGVKVSMNFDEICPKVGKVVHNRDKNGRIKRVKRITKLKSWMLIS